MRSELTLADVRDLEFEILVERAEAILAPFDRPEVETQTEKMERVSWTVDEMPSIYRWFLQLHAFCDHWTDGFARMFSMKDERYKSMRQRRDFCADMASAAKQRYESASRLVTIEMGFSPDGMPRSRGSG